MASLTELGASFAQWGRCVVAWANESDRIANALNSNFTTSLLGALAGAWAGAWAAQRVGAKAKLRDELIAEVRAINVATTLAHAVANTYIQAKRQHIRNLSDALKIDQERHKEFRRRLAAGEVAQGEAFEIQLPLIVLQPISTPVAQLREHVLSRVQAPNRAISLATTMESVAPALNLMLEQRNALLDGMRRDQAQHHARVVMFYLGESAPGAGRTDTTYPDLIRGIANHTDCMIFFGALLCSDLQEHGADVLKRYKRARRFSVWRRELPHVNEVSFAEPEREGLMPDRKGFASWFTAFQKKPRPLTLWGRIKLRLARKPAPA